MRKIDWGFVGVVLPVVLVIGMVTATIIVMSQTEHVYTKCRRLGAEAAELGVPAEANPETHPMDREKWLEGWMSVKRKQQQETKR